MFEDLFSHDWVIALAILAGGVVVGLLLEKIVLVELRAAFKRTTLRAPEAIVGSVRGATAELVIVASAFIAVSQAGFGERLTDALHDVLFVILVFVVSLIVARLAIGAVRMYLAPAGGAVPGTSILANLIRILVFVVGSLVVLDHFDISIMPVLTALGLGSLAIALALQDTLSNLFSGLQILASKQIKPGDFVGLDSGEQGEIIDITWRNTIIREISNNEIIVPNSRMASVTLTNYQLPEQELSIPVEIGVAYGSDLELVERVAAEVALEVVRECEEGVTDFEPLVRFYSFGDSAVEFRVILRAIRYRDRFPLVHEFVKRVHARFAEEGIEIPFPQRVVHMEGSAEDD